MRTQYMTSSGKRASRALLAVLISAGATAAAAQQPATAPGSREAEQPTIVVTASRRAQEVALAPTAMTVIAGTEIAQAPADDYGDLLRNVPGLNVAQTSVRDINLTGRGSTSTLANTQLVLLDGRSVYLDFFGFVMWDLLPIQASEIERIEVVRGPGSAVWGANAMAGVVNVIGRRPKEMAAGTTVLVGTPYASLVHAAPNDFIDFGYKVSVGYFEQPAYDRPTGTIPGSNPPQTYPEYENDGTEQARVNVALEWETSDDAYVSVAAGYADTDGILHSGIGPFDIEKGSNLSYVKSDWHNGNWHVGASATMLDGDAVNLLTRGSDGALLPLSFVSDAYTLDASNTSELGPRHVLTYGASYRTTTFDLGIAPAADDRDEVGAFLEDEIRLGRSLRWVLGARYDDIDPLEDAVVTPRTSLIFSPSPVHSFRVSYNEAFRTPSAVNNYLDVTILQQLGPFFVPADADGNPLLSEERLEAYEIGYVGTFDNQLQLSVAAYRNEIADSIDFYVRDVYGPANLPTPSATLPPTVVPCFLFAPGTGPAACPFAGLAGLVPSDYSYRNIGTTMNRGVELSLERDTGDWSWFVNLSWQDEPDVGGGVDAVEINVAPAWRANLMLAHDSGKRFWNVGVNYQDEAYWADVLFARASTPSFTQVNAAFGWRFASDKVTLKLVAQNLFDEDVQQHIFGDIIGRKLAGQVSIDF
ncbi:MAG TPA: TonB-dependent receptor [Gammaproteobacteria bacterium]|nr:TonB-dependent receptor [Gammaproteobacteria bacterium]